VGSIKRANDGIRTRDIQLGKLALYHLSYIRLSFLQISVDKIKPYFVKVKSILDLHSHPVSGWEWKV
jgi:hypothetical protein